MTQIAKLKLNGEVVGYRGVMDGKLYDIELDALKNLDLLRTLKGVTKSFDLLEVGNLLITEDEQRKGVKVTNISSQPKQIKNLIMNYTMQENLARASKNEPVSKESTVTPQKRPNAIEEKPVIKSANNTKPKTLKFKNGIAVILEQVSAENGEYHLINMNYSVYIVFNTKTAITKACKIAGTYLNKEQIVNNYERGSKSVRANLPIDVFYPLINEFDCKYTIVKDGYILEDSNHHSDSRVHLKVVPPNFDYNKEELKYANIGTSADGESIVEYINNLKESITNGDVIYNPQFALRDIQRM